MGGEELCDMEPTSPSQPALSSASSSRTNYESQCDVCSEKLVKARVHYGGVTCYSCRAFFRRLCKRAETKCRRGSTCIITYKDRKKCIPCRYAKCLKIGMDPFQVLNEEEKKVRFRKLIEKKASLQSTQDQQSTPGLQSTRQEVEYSEHGQTAEDGEPDDGGQVDQNGVNDMVVENVVVKVEEDYIQEFENGIPVLPTSLTFEEPHQLWPKEDQVVHQQQNKPRPQPEQELQEQQQQQQHPNLARKSPESLISRVRPNIKFGTLIPLQPQVLGSTAAAAFAKEKTDNSCSGPNVAKSQPWPIHQPDINENRPFEVDAMNRSQTGEGGRHLLGTSNLSGLEKSLSHLPELREYSTAEGRFDPAAAVGRHVPPTAIGRNGPTAAESRNVPSVVRGRFDSTAAGGRHVFAATGGHNFPTAEGGNLTFDDPSLSQFEDLTAQPPPAYWSAAPTESSAFSAYSDHYRRDAQLRPVSDAAAFATVAAVIGSWTGQAERLPEKENKEAEQLIVEPTCARENFARRSASFYPDTIPRPIYSTSSSLSSCQQQDAWLFNMVREKILNAGRIPDIFKIQGEPMLDVFKVPFLKDIGRSNIRSSFDSVFSSRDDYNITGIVTSTTPSLPSSSLPTSSLSPSGPYPPPANSSWNYSADDSTCQMVTDAPSTITSSPSTELPLSSIACGSGLQPNTSCGRPGVLVMNKPRESLSEMVDRLVSYQMQIYLHKKFGFYLSSGDSSEYSSADELSEKCKPSKGARVSVIKRTRPAATEAAIGSSDSAETSSSNIDGMKIDDKSILDIILSLGLRTIEQKYTEEEARFLENKGEQFWKSWSRFSLGSEVMQYFIEFCRTGEDLHHLFFIISHRQFMRRIVAFLFESDEPAALRLSADDYTILLKCNTPEAMSLFTIWNHCQEDPDKQSFYALGENDYRTWRDHGVPLKSSAEIMQAIPLTKVARRSIFKIMERFKKPWITDSKVYVLLISLIMYNPETPGLVNKERVKAIREEYSTMLRRYLQNGVQRSLVGHATLKIDQLLRVLPTFNQLLSSLQQ